MSLFPNLILNNKLNQNKWLVLIDAKIILIGGFLGTSILYHLQIYMHQKKKFLFGAIQFLSILFWTIKTALFLCTFNSVSETVMGGLMLFGTLQYAPTFQWVLEIFRIRGSVWIQDNSLLEFCLDDYHLRNTRTLILFHRLPELLSINSSRGTMFTHIFLTSCIFFNNLFITQ